MIKNRKLTGKSFSSEQFKVLEDEGIPNMEVIDGMLRAEGKYNVPIYVIRNYLPNSHCNQIKEQFYEVVGDTSGGNRIEDFVKVLQIGSTQFQKSASEYFEECNFTKPSVYKLLSRITDDKVLKDFMLEDSFRKYFFDKKVIYGPSYYHGNYCNLFTARLWNNNEELSLNAHEDLAQLTVAQMDDYEIGSVQTVIASNLCVENSDQAKLILWNIAPDESAKKDLKLEHTGYPYPLSLLDDIEKVSLATQPGDLYFINANYIHAVSKANRNSRISLGRFFGYSSSDRVVYWT